jgi:hypothetical protein
MAIPLLEGLPKPKRLIADKAHDAMSLRRWLKRRRIRAVIPSLATGVVAQLGLRPRLSLSL